MVGFFTEREKPGKGMNFARSENQEGIRSVISDVLS